MDTVATDQHGGGDEEPRWFAGAVQLRRRIHQYPELRFSEHATADVLAERLTEAGYTITRGVATTGVLATLQRGRARKHVMLRAELDALGVPDSKDVEYRSSNDGIAHACGHDVHMAAAVTAAQRLSELDWSGRVSVLLQPAEEIPFGEASGAQAVIDSGAIDFSRVDLVLGLHCWPSLGCGMIGVDADVAMATKDAFRVTVRGRGSHAASPSEGRDAILAVSQIVTLVHGLVGRRVDPAEGVALNVGTIKGGRGQSVVPDHAEIVGTLRTTDDRVRNGLKAAIEDVCRGVGVATDTVPDIEWANEMPAVRNDADALRQAVTALDELQSVELVHHNRPPMTTDDFALYTQLAPSLYFKLGVCGQPDGCPPLHSSDFDVDEASIRHGVDVLTTVALDALRRTAQSDDDTGGHHAGA